MSELKSPSPLAEDPELVSEFIMESQEHLRSIESCLLSIEEGNAAPDAVHAIFRGFHTIKGLAGFLEFDELQKVSHEVETLLDRVRNGELQLTSDRVDVVLSSADYVRQWFVALQSSGTTAAPDSSPILARVAKAASTHAAAEPEVTLATLSESAPDPAAVAPPVETGESVRVQTVQARAVKVDTAKLDHLVDMVGEMVIAQSMIQHDPEMKSINRSRLMRNLTQLARITADVQKTAMAMRMVPIEHLFERMRRLVRDLSRKQGKPIELEVSGGETELDRNLVEELADPLMHMLRNAVDHGIESPGARAAAGKPAAGKLGLRASHRSGHIVIEVSDDGAGLNRDRILEKARSNGLVGPGDELTDERVCDLIFEPGFSTAAKVTDVSGRGVGMDVVRRQVQKLRGRIEISSKPGHGSTFYLKLPLTLAIVDGLIVGVGRERYILPLFAVREMFRPEPGAISTVQDKGEIAMVRGQLLPLIRLYRRFGIVPKSEDPQQTLLIVAEGANRTFCLMVDELIGKQEVVIKNLGSLLQNIPGVAGGAILGDGRVGLIVDLDRVFDPQAGVQSSHAA